MKFIYEIQKLDIIIQDATVDEKELLMNEITMVCTKIWFTIIYDQHFDTPLVLPTATINYNIGCTFIEDEILLQYFPFHNVPEPNYCFAGPNTEWKEIYLHSELIMKTHVSDSNCDMYLYEKFFTGYKASGLKILELLNITVESMIVLKNQLVFDANYFTYQVKSGDKTLDQALESFKSIIYNYMQGFEVKTSQNDFISLNDQHFPIILVADTNKNQGISKQVSIGYNSDSSALQQETQSDILDQSSFSADHELEQSDKAHQSTIVIPSNANSLTSDHEIITSRENKPPHDNVEIVDGDEWMSLPLKQILIDALLHWNNFESIKRINYIRSNKFTPSNLSLSVENDIIDLMFNVESDEWPETKKDICGISGCEYMSSEGKMRNHFKLAHGMNTSHMRDEVNFHISSLMKK